MSPSDNEVGSRPGHRPDLQGLRAAAILLVLLAHAEVPFFAGGFIGVDVFFVLSGYLITGLLARELERSGGISLAGFYARRLKRLLPALAVMLAASYGIASLLLSNAELVAQTASGPFAATWTSNVYFAFRAVGYFEELASRDLFLHTWSLGVEEQFYLVWPLLLLLLFRLGRFRENAEAGGSGALRQGLTVAFALSLAASVYWTFSAPPAAFYLMPSRIWQFALGALVHYTSESGRAGEIGLTSRRDRVLTWTTLLTGLALIFGSAFALHPGLPYPGYWAVVPSLGAALVIAAGRGLSDGRGGPLAHPALVWLGDRSYSLYLWHWPVLAVGFSLGLPTQASLSLGLVLVSLLAAILSYRIVEHPFWKGRYSHAPPARVILVSLLVMAGVVFLLTPGSRRLDDAPTSPDISNAWRADVPLIYRMPCDAWYSHDRVEPCIFGNESAANTVVVLGDSIGLQWFSAFPEIFPAPEWRIIVLTKSSCAMVDEDYYYARIGKVYRVCTTWRNAVLDTIETLRPEMVIVGSAATYGFSEESWVEGSARVFQRLSRSAGNVFVIPGTPSLEFDGPGCVIRNLSASGHINRSACVSRDRLDQIKGVSNNLEQAAGRFSNVHILDLNDLICPGGDCSAVSEDGLVVFRDSQHLTDSFVLSRVRPIREKLDLAGNR
jgi:peptidoglycan/LPS O-acetylase OafA/YrhL